MGCLEHMGKARSPFVARRGRPSLYEFNRLEIGDHYLIPPSHAVSAGASASYYKRRTPGWNYSNHKLPDGSVKITRVA